MDTPPPLAAVPPAKQLLFKQLVDQLRYVLGIAAIALGGA